MAGDDLADARRSAESWYWWGIPTFFRCPMERGSGGRGHRAGWRSAQFRQWLDGTRPASGPARGAECIGLLPPRPWSSWFCALRGGAHPRPGRRSPARGHEQRSLRSRYRSLFRAARCGPGRGPSRSAAIIRSPDRSSRRWRGRSAARRGASPAHSFISMRTPIPTRTCPHWLGAKRSAAHWAAYTARRRCGRSFTQYPDRHARPSLLSDPCGGKSADRARRWATGRAPWRSSRTWASLKSIAMIRAARRRRARLHHLRSRLPRPLGRAGRVQSGTWLWRHDHSRGDPSPAGPARVSTSSAPMSSA